MKQNTWLWIFWGFVGLEMNETSTTTHRSSSHSNVAMVRGAFSTQDTYLLCTHGVILLFYCH